MVFLNRFATVVLGLFLVINGAFATDSLTVDSTIVEQVTEDVTAGEELTKDIFHNVTIKGKEGSAKVTWSIDYQAIHQLEGKQIIIKYNTKIGAKRHKSGFENSDWKYSEPLDIYETSATLKDLVENEKYEAYIGVAKNGYTIEEAKDDKEKMIWSSKAKFKTSRGWGIMKFLILIGSLGLFIFGMKVMSEGLQQAAGSKLRKMLGSITSNRVKGVITGFMSTAIVQSSSVTTVMTVSLVNAGLLTLRQSAGVMMGANIGTTITAWLVLMIGFKVSISSYAYVILAFGAPLLFMRFKNAKPLSNTIIGFSILFLGLGALKSAVPSLGIDSALVQFFTDFKDVWYGPVMFVILGALVTVIVQSSSAAMTLTMVMVAAGAIPYEVACAMILGENIGTTITAEIASAIGNVHAKRSARIHSIFNVIGVTWMLLIYPYFIQGISYIVTGSTVIDPTDTFAANTGLALFHTTFNLMNVFVLIWFVPQLVKFAEKGVKSKGESDEEFHLEFINDNLMGTGDLAILEARKEVARFGKITGKMSGFVFKLLREQDRKVKTKLHNKVHKYEEITDRVEVEIANYLGKATQGEMSESASGSARAMLSITNDLERIGDIFYTMSKTIERKDDEKIWFIQEQRDGIDAMFKKIDQAFEIMATNLSTEYTQGGLVTARDKENEINSLRNQLRKQHLVNLEKGEYTMQSGMVYSDLFSSLERIGDHIINVSEAVEGEV